MSQRSINIYPFHVETKPYIFLHQFNLLALLFLSELERIHTKICTFFDERMQGKRAAEKWSYTKVKTWYGRNFKQKDTIMCYKSYNLQHQYMWNWKAKGQKRQNTWNKLNPQYPNQKTWSKTICYLHPKKVPKTTPKLPPQNQLGQPIRHYIQ